MQKSLIILLLTPFLLFSILPVASAEGVGEKQWENEVIYFLMVDRFNNGDPTNDFDVDTNNPTSYHGGDIKGIINRLDYIKDMGFTSILLSPIFQNSPDGYEGFSIEDYYEVEEHFGDLSLFKDLVKKAHEKDMKIFVDLGIHEDNIETLNKDVILDASKWWIEETKIDGYSINSADKLSKEFLEELSSTTKAVKEDFFLLGLPSDYKNVNDLEDLSNVGIDTVLNLPLYHGLRETFSITDGQFENAEEIWAQTQSEMNNPYLVGNFIDNHETSRFTYLTTEQNEHPAPRIKLALTYIFTTPGIPVMYYGTEIALNGAEPPSNHKLMNFQTDKELIEYITLLGKIKKDFSVFSKGDFEILSNKDGMIVFQREFEDQTAIVAINNSAKTQKLVLPENQIGENKELRGILDEEIVRTVEGEFNIVVNRDLAQVYIVQNKTGINYTLIGAVIIVPLLMVLFLFLNKKRYSPNKE